VWSDADDRSLLAVVALTVPGQEVSTAGQCGQRTDDAETR